MTNTTLHFLMENVSLILGIHQQGLLLESEKTGEISCGSGVSLILDQITDIATASEIHAKQRLSVLFKDRASR